MLKVSIITIVFNGEKTIRETIDSVLEQDYSNIEYIVKDGGSTDNTVKIVEAFGDKVRLIQKKDNGLYDAVNQGIEYATGDIIGLIHADDVLSSPDCISAIVNTFEQTQADIVYGDTVIVQPDNPEKIFRYWRAGIYKRENILKGWIPPHLSCYIKKEAYFKHGLYRTDMYISADYDLLLRFIYLAGLKVHYLPKVLVKMRKGGRSTKNILRTLIGSYEVYQSMRRNGLNVSPLIIIMKPVFKVTQLFHKKIN